MSGARPSKLSKPEKTFSQVSCTTSSASALLCTCIAATRSIAGPCWRTSPRKASSSPPRTAMSMPTGFRLAQVPALRPVLAHILPRRMIVSSVRNVYGHPERVTPELVDRYFDLMLRAGNRQALGERFRQNQNGEFASQVKQLRQPTLILWDGQDRLIPPETADLFLRDTAGSGAVRFEDLGHVPHEEDPARTVLAVQAFLAG